MDKFFVIGFVLMMFSLESLTVPLPDIPGLDHLMSGFDASKMKSIADLETVSQSDKIKAVIFDWSELGRSFVLKTDGHTQIFQTPSIVHVTDVSRRTETTCQAIATSFEEFYYYYFESTSFSAGIGDANISASIGYNKILEKAYNATNDRKQAVGISRKWWGMYSMQLPPVFLLPYNQYFDMSVKRLQQIGTPKTETHQNIYNSIIKAYGTHYVTSVIMGGTASMYTFVNTSYSKKQSYEKTSEQISLNFKFHELSTVVGQINSSSYSEKLSKEFLQNSNDVTEFYPPVKTEQGESEWNVWKSTAWQQPVVVNRTVSPITDLVADYPDIQTHLEKTIEYYMEFNEYPKLKQIE